MPIAKSVAESLVSSEASSWVGQPGAVERISDSPDAGAVAGFPTGSGEAWLESSNVPHATQSIRLSMAGSGSTKQTALLVPTLPAIAA